MDRARGNGPNCQVRDTVGKSRLNCHRGGFRDVWVDISLGLCMRFFAWLRRLFK